MKQEKVFDMPVTSFDIEEASPPKSSYVVVKLVDSVSGKVKIRSAYYENGVFWDSESSQACGIETSSKECRGEKKFYITGKLLLGFWLIFSLEKFLTKF